MSVINTNVMSLNAQRNLTTNSADLGTTIQRLSSGLRINSAKDDAAGLAISERFTTQVRGMDQAARNANDGISLAQTAEGALAEIGNNLQRIRELAVQSSNATNSTDDRKALQKEVTQLQSEIQRVAENTDFNGTKLLDGSFAGQAFQVGANAGQLISVDGIANAQTSSLGSTEFAAAVSGAAVDGETASEGLEINGVAIANVDANDANGGADFATSLASAINAKTAETGVIATVGGDGKNEITLTSTTAGKELIVAGTAEAESGFADIDGDDATLAASTVKDVDIKTFAGAQQAISIMDSALKGVNEARADLGAIQNRFSSVVTNLQTSSENLSAARSRIMDADYAKETANLSRTQILQQAGTAMLAQANQMPQNVLSLLR